MRRLTSFERVFFMPIRIVLLAVLILLCGLAAPARADRSHWEPGYWEDQNDRAYIEPGTGTQNTQWDDDPWSPQAWAQQRQHGDKKDGDRQVIAGFFKADILRKLYTEDGTPAVRVGPAFYALGGQDQRRVAAMIDDAYGVTANKLYGMFTLYDWNNHRAIGTYTQYGLQMK